MQLSSITAVSPIDGRYADKTHELRPIFSEYGLIHHRVRVEIQWLLALSHLDALAEVPRLSPNAETRLHQIVEEFNEADAMGIKVIEARINHDVKAVEYFIKDKIEGDAELTKTREFFHFACTSEDINNLAYGLMLSNARTNVLLPACDRIITKLREMAHAYADTVMLAHTHGQPASPTTMGKELANIVNRLKDQRARIAETKIKGKINGAVGNYNAHLVAYPEIDWPGFAYEFVTALGLVWNPYTTQIEPHDGMAELFHAMVRFNIVLIDLCRDLWAYIAIGYFKQKLVDDEVGSSTMPHKINPIDFENAEGNLGLANALLEHLASKLPISRWQRDLTDSTALRDIGAGFAHTLISYQSLLIGLAKLEVDEVCLRLDLEAHWEVLTEAIQTVMRRYNVPEPYEQLKRLARGKPVDAATIQAFVMKLTIPDEVKERLLDLTPATYTGNAAALAKAV